MALLNMARVLSMVIDCLGCGMSSSPPLIPVCWPRTEEEEEKSRTPFPLFFFLLHFLE
jgi:hypothetical protein